jgi:hypothetical protein
LDAKNTRKYMLPFLQNTCRITITLMWLSLKKEVYRPLLLTKHTAVQILYAVASVGRWQY